MVCAFALIAVVLLIAWLIDRLRYWHIDKICRLDLFDTRNIEVKLPFRHLRRRYLRIKSYDINAKGEKPKSKKIVSVYQILVPEISMCKGKRCKLIVGANSLIVDVREDDGKVMKVDLSYDEHAALQEQALKEMFLVWFRKDIEDRRKRWKQKLFLAC
ncbi:MAG: hypothetical protein NTZ80_03690 [Patescibacteria group bacterium]|nr:hypothetical protein [Patescibacteria group bacterium]